MKTQSRRLAIANSLAAITAAPYALPHTNSPAPGRIYEANSSLFTNSHYTESLTGFATGVKDTSGVAEALDFYAPMVLASRKFEYLELNPDDDFDSDDGDDDERAIGEDFKEVKHNQEMVLGKVKNRGLSIVLDEDEYDEDPDAEERAVERLIKRLERNELRRAIALLSAAAVNTNRVWDTSAGKDPDQDVQLSIIAGADASGMQANRVGYGQTAFAKRTTSHRAQDNAGGFGSADKTPEQVAAYLQVDGVHVNKSRYNNGATKSQIMPNNVISFYAEEGLGREDASNIKRFVKLINGQRYRVYRQELGPMRVRITVAHYSNTIITSTLGIRQETIA